MTVAELLADLREHGDLLPVAERPVTRPGERVGEPVVIGQTTVFGPPDAGQAAQIRSSWGGSPWQAAQMIAVRLGQPFKPIALYRWRRKGIGPPSTQEPTEPSYRLADVDDWIDELT